MEHAHPAIIPLVTEPTLAIVPAILTNGWRHTGRHAHHACKTVVSNSQNQKCELQIQRIGLANTLTVRCTYRSQRCDGHYWSVDPSSNPKIKKAYNKAYDVNNLSIVAAHQTGIGYVSIKRFFAIMGVEYMTQSGYYSVEKHVGKVLVELKKDSIKRSWRRKSN